MRIKLYLVSPTPTYNAENPVIAISTEFQKKKNFKKSLPSFNIDLDREGEQPLLLKGIVVLFSTLVVK